MATIDNIPNLLKGTWQFEDGRKIIFFENTTFQVLSSDESVSLNGKYFLKQNQDFISITLPELMDVATIINSLTENEFIYTDYSLDGTKNKRFLTRIS